MKRWMSKVVAVGSLCLTMAAGVSAQNAEATPPAVAGSLPVGEKELAERVKALEAKQTAQAEEQGMFLAAYRNRFAIGIFGDVQFATESRELENNGFALGQTDLYGTANDGNRLNMLFELVSEYDGATPVADLERIWVGYVLNDAITVRFGKQHTAYGYWAKSFHHGAYLYTTIGRPFFLKFEDEGSIVPAHITGFELEGNIATRLAKFGYNAQLGNGASVVNGPEGIGELDQQTVSDDNDDKLIIARLSASPSAVPNLSAGLFGSYARVVARSDDPMLASFVRYNDAPQTIAGAYLVYHGNQWEFISEYLHIENSIEGLNDFVNEAGATVLAADSRDTANDAFYVQVGRTLYDKYTPYVRYEELYMDETDAYMRNLNQANRRQWLAGVRYDLTANSCLKFQYRNDHSEGVATGGGTAPDQTFDVFEFQWAFNF